MRELGRRLRREVLKRSTVTTALRFTALVCLAVGAWSALDGRWALTAVSAVSGAVLLWLCAAWVFPRGKDALARYYGRVREAWRDRQAAVQIASAGANRRRRKLRARLNELRPPPGFEAEHAELVELLNRADAMRRDPSLSLIEREREALVSLGAAREVIARLIAHTRDAPGNYARALERLTSQSAAVSANEDRTLTRADEALAHRFASTRAPAEVSAEHDALIHSLERYLDAEKKARASFRTLDPTALTRSLITHDSARTEFDRAFAALHQRLAESNAWAVRQDEIARGDRAMRHTS